MGIKDAMMTISETVYPDDFDAQTDLEERIMDGVSLSDAEASIASRCDGAALLGLVAAA